MGMDAHEMRHDVTDQVRGQVHEKMCDKSLFRSNATRSAGNRLFGSVIVMVPPSAIGTLIIALSALLALGFVAWYVEIPQRASAIGVLMPPGGFLDVVADAPGRVTSIAAAEGRTIAAGDLLLNITTDRFGTSAHNRDS